MPKASTKKIQKNIDQQNTSPKGDFVPLLVLADKYGYAKDHLGWLARTGRIEAIRQGKYGQWYASENSLKTYQGVLAESKKKRINDYVKSAQLARSRLAKSDIQSSDFKVSVVPSIVPSIPSSNASNKDEVVLYEIDNQSSLSAEAEDLITKRINTVLAALLLVGGIFIFTYLAPKKSDRAYSFLKEPIQLAIDSIRDFGLNSTKFATNLFKKNTPPVVQKTPEIPIAIVTSSPVPVSSQLPVPVYQPTTDTQIIREIIRENTKETIITREIDQQRIDEINVRINGLSLRIDNLPVATPFVPTIWQLPPTNTSGIGPITLNPEHLRSQTLTVLGASSLTTLAVSSTSTFTGDSTFLGYASASEYFGGGLTDCDADNQALSWDASTGKFSCGDDDNSGVGGGVSSNSLDFDEIVNSMTLDGNLTVSRGTGYFIGLGSAPSTVFEVQGTASASYFLTGNTIQVGGFSSAAYSRFGTSTTTHSNYISGLSDLLVSGDLQVISTGSFGIASISYFKLTDSSTGVHMVDCDDENKALGWDITTGRFYCGTDGGSVSSNSLNFDEFQDALVIDAAQTVTSGSFNFNWGGTNMLNLGSITTGSGDEAIFGGALQVGGTSSVAYSRFGTTTTGHSNFITTTNDLLISGDFEVDASAIFDSFVMITNTATASLDIRSGSNDEKKFTFRSNYQGAGFSERLSLLNGAGIELLSVSSTGFTDIDTLRTGALSFEDNAGIISWTNIEITSASSGTVMSYTAQIDSNDILTVYGLADASNGLGRRGVGINTSTPQTMFEVQGTSSASYFITGNTLQVGGFSSAAYSRFGTSTTTHTNYISGINDLLISGDLQVISTGSFGIASISYFKLTDSSTGVHMVDCDADNQALGWDITTGRFFCGDDDSGSTISSNSLNFDEFQDALVIDAAQTVTSGSFNFNWGGTNMLNLGSITTGSGDEAIFGGALQVGGTSSVAYSRFGTTDTTHSNWISTSSDLFLSNDLEGRGSISFVGPASFSNTLWISPGGNTGEVGIGTRTPSENLHIFNSGDVDTFVRFQNSDSTANIGISAVDNAVIINGISTGVSILAGNAQVYTVTAGGDTSILNATGTTIAFFQGNSSGRPFVGIGTTSPSTKFEVQGTSSASYFLTGNTLQVGGYSSAAYSRFGTTSTTHTNYISGSNDLLISGDLQVISTGSFGIASISYFKLTDSATGVHMVDCDADNQALGWDITTGRFFCGDDDQGSGSVSSNSLNFDEFQDALVIDAAQTVTSGSFNFNWGGTNMLNLGSITTGSGDEAIFGGALQVGDTSSVAYSRFGTNITTYSTFLTTTNDLLLSGNLEVDLKSFFDAPIEVQGTASASYFLTGNTLQVGGYSSAAYSRFGTDTTSYSNFITTTNDLLISGDLEVNSSAQFDSFTRVSLSSTRAFAVTDMGGNRDDIFVVDTTSSTSNSGIEITGGTGQASPLLLINNTSSTIGTIASIQASSLTRGDVFTLEVPASTSHSGRYLLVEDTNNVVYASMGSGGRFAIRRDIRSHGATSTCTGVGTPSAGCIDVAEEFPSSELIEKGELVSIDTGNDLNSVVKRASGSYDPNLIGVVSTKPGVVLGESVHTGSNAEGYESPEGKVVVALVGRVPVKISYENGDIKKGDYLTSSSISGRAMKATESGRVIGLALEDAAEVDGKDSVTVFINPHYMTKGIDFTQSSGTLNFDPSIINVSLMFSLIVDQFESMFDIIFEKGLLKIAKIITGELCLDDVCIDKDQLRILLEKNNLLSPTPTPNLISTPIPTLTPTSTPEITPETTPDTSSTTTPDPTPTQTPEPTPDITPNPIPEPTPEPTPISTPEPTPEPTPISTPEPTPEVTP